MQQASQDDTETELSGPGQPGLADYEDGKEGIKQLRTAWHKTHYYN